VWLLFASVFAIAQGCSSSYGVDPTSHRDGGKTNGSDDDSEPDASAEGGAEGGSGADPVAWATAFCGHDERCYPLYMTEAFTSQEDCVTQRTTTATVEFGSAGFTLTPSQLSACIAKIGAACIDVFAKLPECDWKGARPSGASCAYSGQCATGSCYKATSSVECGVCTPRAQEGQSCATAACAPELFCESGFCAKPVAENGACSSALFCANDHACVSGKCKPLQPKDAACDVAGNDCEYTQGMVCLPTSSGAATGKCGAVPAAHIGQPCGWDTAHQVYTVCVASTCSSATAQGTCGAYLADGAACSANDGPECNLDTSDCASDGHCKAIDPKLCQ
jgi:hypothetical protein